MLDFEIEPKRGRKPLPVNLGLFVRDYLLKHGKGTQQDIHRAYRESLREAYEEAGTRFVKSMGLSYHSFQYHFYLLKKLHWVKAVGEERSEIQEYAKKGQPRVYYELTEEGKAADDVAWSNPRQIAYPHFNAEYYREKSKLYREQRRAKGLPVRRRF